MGTVGALLVALVLLGFQAWDRRRDARDRHRAQAELIGAAMGPSERSGSTGDPTAGRTGIDLFNGSLSPVYGLVVGIVDLQGTAPEKIERWLELRGKGTRAIPVTTMSILPPGTFRAWIPGTGHTASMGARPGPEIAFTDRAGKHWIRRGSGRLAELGVAPVDYFRRWGFYGPYELQTPERVE